jgi:hypothetical protein
MNQTHIIAIAILMNICSITVNGQEKIEAESGETYIEQDYETESYYEESDYYPEDDYDWLNQRKQELENCDDLIIYGDKNNANYFRIFNEGKERFLYFDEVLVTTKNGELNAVYYPRLFRGERSNEISMHISKNFFNSDEFECRPQQTGSGNITQDCIDWFPQNLLNKNAFSRLEILKIEKDSKGKYATVSFQFYFVDEDDFGNEISLQGVVNTNNIVDLSDSYQASTKNIKGENINDEVNYLFYTEGGESTTLFSVGRYYGDQFRTFMRSTNPQITPNNQTAELIAIEKYHPEYIQLNYYEGKVLDYDENRIFDFANYQQPKVSDITLIKTISAINPSKIRPLKDVDFAPYTQNNNSTDQLLPFKNLPVGESFILRSTKDYSNSYCPASLEGFCVSETIKNTKGVSDIYIISEENENWTVLDDLFDDIIKLQLNTSVKYWRYLKNNDTTFLVNLLADYDSLLIKYNIPFESNGDFFRQIENARGSFEQVAILNKQFGDNQVKLSSQKIRDNNERYRNIVEKWSSNFEIKRFHADYWEILETIAMENLYPNDFENSYSDMESMYETEAGNDEYEEGFYADDDYSQRENHEIKVETVNTNEETQTTENNQKINTLIANLFAKYGMPYDQNSTPESFQRLILNSPKISERFGEASPYILEKLMQVQDGSTMSKLYERYFPNNSEPPFHPQMLMVMTKTGMPISRSFTHYETDFSIEYEGDSILLKATNLTQGSDQVKIHSPSNCYDIFSLTSIISHQKIDKSLNKTMLLFDLIPEKSRSYSYSGSVELNLENDEADVEEMVPQIRNSINARPEFFLATITFDSEGTIGNDTPFYLLKVAVSGNIRNSLFDYYTQDAAFYIQVAKSFPHYVLSIYN